MKCTNPECGHALVIHEDAKDPKTGEVTKYAGPCMFKMPAGVKSDGKTNNNGGYCPCAAGQR
jgi:hypothetical protein